MSNELYVQFSVSNIHFMHHKHQENAKFNFQANVAYSL